MLGWLIAGLVLYLGICGAIFAMQRNLQYFPDRNIPIPAEYGLTEFSTVSIITADGLALSGWYAAAVQGRPTIVHFHGNAGHVGYRARIARTLHDAGYGVLLAGYRGYGGNPGSPTEQGFYTDGRAWLDWLVERGVSGRSLVLYGESLGSGIAVLLATERKAAALILEAPFTSATDVAARAYPFLPVRLLMKDRFDNLSRIADIQSPLLIVHGVRDTIVPVSQGERLLAAGPEPKRGVWLEQAGHNDLLLHGLEHTVLDFLAEIDGRKSAAAVTLNLSIRRGTAVIPYPP